MYQSAIREGKLTNGKLHKTLLDNACEGKTLEIIEYLDEGVNINEQFVGHFSNNPSHISVIKQDVELLSILQRITRTWKVNLQ